MQVASRSGESFEYKGRKGGTDETYQKTSSPAKGRKARARLSFVTQRKRLREKRGPSGEKEDNVRALEKKTAQTKWG